MPNPPRATTAHEQRKLLRLTIDGTMLVEHDGKRETYPCLEVSRAGVFVAVEPAWPDDTEVECISLAAFSQTFELRVQAAVLHSRAPTDEMPAGCELEFVDMDIIQRSDVEAAFAEAVRQVMKKPERPDMQFDWVFRDANQVSLVCRALLHLVDFEDAWTRVGPSELTRQCLSGQDTSVPALKRSMLSIVWTLWCGNLELPDPEDDELARAALGSILALKNAMLRGPNGIDEWLRVEARG